MNLDEIREIRKKYVHFYLCATFDDALNISIDSEDSLDIHYGWYHEDLLESLRNDDWDFIFSKYGKFEGTQHTYWIEGLYYVGSDDDGYRSWNTYEIIDAKIEIAQPFEDINNESILKDATLW